MGYVPLHIQSELIYAILKSVRQDEPLGDAVFWKAVKQRYPKLRRYKPGLIREHNGLCGKHGCLSSYTDYGDYFTVGEITEKAQTFIEEEFVGRALFAKLPWPSVHRNVLTGIFGPINLILFLYVLFVRSDAPKKHCWPAESISR